MKTIFSALDKRSPKYVLRLTLAAIVVLSILSALVGHRVFLEPFFILPITLASWYGSRKSGAVLALSSALLMTLIKVLQSNATWDIWIFYGFPCATAFVALAIIVTNFHNVHRVESEAADTDYLTKINNTRGFYVELANEMVRASRYEHIFSLVYIDIDHFKQINDSLGHAEGDRLLIQVAQCLKESFRATDIVSRLGGDEFACLLPETSQAQAKQAIKTTRQSLGRRMEDHKWSVSFSIGVVTFEKMPADIKEAVKIADELMYTVKAKRKNNVAFQVWRGSDPIP